MATSSFSKNFRVDKQSALSFQETMEKEVPRTLDVNFKTRYTDDKSVISKLVKGILKKVKQS